jgi:hypothetical protein
MKQVSNQDFFSNPLLIALAIIIGVWTLFWKGIALWRTSQLKQRNWFIALFILVPLNELAIIELVYLFWFSKKRLTIGEIKGWFVKK